MVVADDYHLEEGGAQYRLALMMFFVLSSTVGVCVVFELLHRTLGHLAAQS